MNAIALGAIIMAVVAILVASSDSQTPDPKQLVEPMFNRVFGSLSLPPKLKISSSYGYPAFEVSFGSKAEMEGAAMLNADFKRELGSLFKDYGASGRKFDAELAVCFAYPGYIDDLVESFRLKSVDVKKESNQRATDNDGAAPHRV